MQEEKKHQEKESNLDKEVHAQEGLIMDFFGENYEINFDMNNVIIWANPSFKSLTLVDFSSQNFILSNRINNCLKIYLLLYGNW